MPLLKMDHVGKKYRGPMGIVQACADVSLELDAGEFLAIQGPSGCGKTTVLLAAGGVLEPSEGRVVVDGEDVYSLSPASRARLRAATIGFVFQQFHLVPYLSVFENVLAPSIALPHPDARERAIELVDRFGLAERMHHVPGQLSTGERQRTALARAMLNRPKLLLADEPTGNLDPTNGAAVLDYMKDFAQHGGAVLLVTHDAAAAAQASRIMRLRRA